MDYLLDVITAFGAPAVIATIIIKYYIDRHNDKVDREAKEKAEKEYKDEVEKRFELGSKKFLLLEKKMMIIGKSSLRHEMTDSELPIRERVRAYEEYSNEFNGNGYMKEYYETVLIPLLKLEFKENRV